MIGKLDCELRESGLNYRCETNHPDRAHPVGTAAEIRKLASVARPNRTRDFAREKPAGRVVDESKCKMACGLARARQLHTDRLEQPNFPNAGPRK